MVNVLHSQFWIKHHERCSKNISEVTQEKQVPNEMNVEISEVIHRQLTRTGMENLEYSADKCEKRRELESKRIEELKRFLVKKNIIDPETSKLEIRRCQLEPLWNGVIDLKSTTTDPAKMLTKPSIAWTCEQYECHLEADLPVPWAKRHDFKKEFAFFDTKCAVTETHIHEDAIAPEAHIHVICKGITPSNLASTISRLTKKVMTYRGHEEEYYPNTV